MHSVIIASKDKEKALEYAISFCSSLGIDKIDMDILRSEKQAGIEDMRNLKKRIFLKPIKGGNKAVIIEAGQGLTIGAQNALLKILEEPPENTIIIVCVLIKEDLLPTIISRCRVIELAVREQKPSPEELSALNFQLLTLSKGDAGDRLKLAQDFGKNREEAVSLLEKMILVARKNILLLAQRPSDKNENNLSESLSLLKSLNETYTVIKTTNVNQRLALENLFLNLL